MAMAFGLKDVAFTVPPKKQVQRLAGRPWLGNPACTKGWSQPEMDIDGGDILILSNFSLQLILSVTAHSDKASVSNPAS